MSDIASIIIDILSDVELRQSTEKEVHRRYGKGAIAGLSFKNPRRIDIVRGQDHQEKIRCLLHEVAHYYCAYVLSDLDASEEKVNAIASCWHEEIYRR